MSRFLFPIVVVLLFPWFSFGGSIRVTMYPTTANEKDASIGTVLLTDTPYGLLIQPELTIATGRYGFHIHEHSSCDNAGKAAGGHLDPQQTKAHKGPYDSSGHLGDLPLLVVDGQLPMPSSLAPRLMVKDVKDHALMIHEHGDNYADQPQSLGGGGNRMFCGVISSFAQK